MNSTTIEDVFGPEGPIARALPGFEARPGQVQMAQLVERGILEGMHTIVEAGTGVGKSLAYLVPAVRSGKKIVLSTGTIALQEQLVRKDLPLVERALGIPLRVTLLKGRSHYLCKQKFERMRADRLVASSRSMQQIWDWGVRTQTGDRAELPFLPSSDEWEQLDADADDCVGEFCEHFRDCFFFKKRDEAKFADIVVVNHALFFLDLAMGGGLLPPYDVAILDEAHQAERWATDALTATLSRSTLARMMRKLHRTYNVPPHFDGEIEGGVRGLESTLASVPGDRYPLAANEDAGPALEDLRGTLYKLENWLFANWHSALKKRPDNDAEAERRRDLAMRAVLAHEAAIDRAQAPADEAIAWVERGDGDGRYEVNCAPYDVAEFLRATLFTQTQSVILTSATISVCCTRRRERKQFRLLETIARHSRCARVDRALALRLSETSAALYCAGTTQSEIHRLFRVAPRRSSKSVSIAAADERLCFSRPMRDCARCTRWSASAFHSRSNCRARCRARICCIGFAQPAMPCSLPPERFGKASTSPATPYRASSSIGFRFRLPPIRWSQLASAHSKRAGKTDSKTT